MQNMIIDQAQPYMQQVIELLEAEKLPTADLPQTLDNFIVAIQNGSVTGVAGIEIYAQYGLLRSVAVQAGQRNLGIAGNLLTRLEALSKLKGVTTWYLLNETTPAYFERKGFIKITRADVPAEVQCSSEFSHVCPASAIVMKKEL